MNEYRIIELARVGKPHPYTVRFESLNLRSTKAPAFVVLKEAVSKARGRLS
jgi:hypothetical protein